MKRLLTLSEVIWGSKCKNGLTGSWLCTDNRPKHTVMHLKKNQVYTLPGAGDSAGKKLVKFKIPNLCNVRKMITD